MSLLTFGRTRPSDGTAPVVQFPQGIAVGLVAAGLGYTLHHLPFLEDHAMLGAALSLAVAGIAAVAVGAIMVPGPRRVLPVVVMSAPTDSRAQPLSRGQLDFCVALHREALGHGVFVELGERFMRAYYATFLDSPHAIALGANVAGQPVGFLVGAVRARAHARWVLRHRAPLLAALALTGLVRHPGAAFRFVRTRLSRYATAWRRHTREEREQQPSNGGDPAVLTHVAVVPGARTAGAGRALVEVFADEVRRGGIERALLTTLADDAGAGGFYLRLGWERSAVHTTVDGRRMEEWTLDLRERASG
jgi:GNAT superfamily N-acetyltransferase